MLLLLRFRCRCMFLILPGTQPRSALLRTASRWVQMKPCISRHCGSTSWNLCHPMLVSIFGRTLCQAISGICLQTPQHVCLPTLCVRKYLCQYFTVTALLSLDSDDRLDWHRHRWSNLISQATFHPTGHGASTPLLRLAMAARAALITILMTLSSTDGDRSNSFEAQYIHGEQRLSNIAANLLSSRYGVDTLVQKPVHNILHEANSYWDQRVPAFQSQATTEVCISCRAFSVFEKNS